MAQLLLQNSDPLGSICRNITSILDGYPEQLKNGRRKPKGKPGLNWDLRQTR